MHCTQQGFKENPKALVTNGDEKCSTGGALSHSDHLTYEAKIKPIILYP
jgi:hypothetical protein